MLDKFQFESEAVGATVKRFTLLDDAAAYATDLAESGIAVASALPANIRVAFGDSFFSPQKSAAGAKLCVSFALAGIARTGSILLDLKNGMDRDCASLAAKHAVFLPASKIVSDLYALQDRLNEILCQPHAARLSITTGPSRTADIERVLTIGVHGPKELHLLVMEGD